MTNGFDMLDAISKIGFPIAVAVYLLVRFEKKLDDTIQTIRGKDGVLDKIEEILNKIADCCKR